MSVKTLESYQEFTADGSTTYFTFNFNYVDSSEIIVGMRTGDNQYTVVDPVNYVLTKNASTDGGKIRFVTTKPCENPDDPTCGDYIDNPPPAGTIVRIERKTVQSSTADWYVALDMKALVGLFDKLFRISQENSDKFKNTIQTFPTQQGITVRELLSEHDKKIFYWNNEKQWLDITDFTIDDVVRQTDIGDILAQANAYSDEQNALLENRINGKLTAVNAQIDANADAIQKTREDYIQADSEIHQILNSHAENLTTLHNDVDDLGDQVAEIESKIPESASAENPLVTRSEISSVYKFKGSVTTYNDLPTGATVGDVYNVTDTGANYAWDGSAWDKLSETVDLSSYATTAYVNAREQDIRDDYIQADSELQQQINAHATAITNLEDGVDSINGKIPTNASTTNLLVSTSQLNTGIQDVRADFMADDAALQTQINGQATTIAGIQDDITGINSKISNSASSTNKLVSASELSATEQDIRADMNETDSQLQTQITAQAAEIAGKQDQLTAGNNITIVDNVISATGGGGGDFLPLAGGTMTGNISFEYGSGEQFIGASEANGGILISLQGVNDSRYANYYFEGVSFYGRAFYGNYNLTLGHNMYPWGRAYIQKINSGNGGADIIVPTEGGTLARLEDLADIGGGGGITNVVHDTTLTGSGTDASPLGLAETIKDEIASKAPTATVEALTQVVNGIIGDYVKKTGDTMTGALNVPEITVQTAEGTFTVSVVAGVVTIATNNGLDFASPVKFDTAPTTDDNTTYANALDTSLVRKAQVATAIADAMANVDALPDQTGNAGKVLTTDGSTASWQEPQGGGDYLPLTGGTLTGSLFFETGSARYEIRPTLWGTLSVVVNGSVIADFETNTGFLPDRSDTYSLGRVARVWKNVFTARLNNGADLAVPTTGGTIARVEDIDAIGGVGTTGQVLTKTDTGMAWADASGGDGDIDCGVMS